MRASAPKFRGCPTLENKHTMRRLDMLNLHRANQFRKMAHSGSFKAVYISEATSFDCNSCLCCAHDKLQTRRLMTLVSKDAGDPFIQNSTSDSLRASIRSPLEPRLRILKLEVLLQRLPRFKMICKPKDVSIKLF